MTDGQIRQAMQRGDLEMVNFDEKSLEPASYDVRLGEEAITSSDRRKVNPAGRGLFTIPAGDFALVSCHERMHLSPNVAGHIGLRSHYSKKGLVLLSGPQIDPGFKGALVIGLANLSPRDVVIPYKEKLCTLEFYALSEPASRPYSGEYQDQAGISARDLENLVEAAGMTFGQVIKLLAEVSQNVKTLSDSVKTLSDSISFLKWAFSAVIAVMTIGFAVIGILVTTR